MKVKSKSKVGETKNSDNAQPAEASPQQRDLRREQGNELRKKCPRSSHAQVIVGQTKCDPLTWLEESNRGRLEALLPLRFTRMVESPFAFFRGTAVLQAHDLQGTPAAGITVQCCGDCHLMNFGGFATPERTMVFDINDFDETLPGPFEWDLKRLATSFVLGGRWLGFSKGDVKDATQAAVASYRQAQARFANMSVLDTWYAMITVDEILKDVAGNEDAERKIKKDVMKARQNTSEHVFQKITNVVNGKPRIADQPPLLFHVNEAQADFDAIVSRFFAEYKATLAADRHVLLDRYKIIDAAHKVVGVGSVGTRCYVALLEDSQDHYLFLQVKEARPSVLEGKASQSRFANQGERVVVGQRLMQAASDIFLGWAHGPEGQDFYVRQLRDMKLTADLRTFGPALLIAYAQLCGATLARAHAKAGDATLITGYLGSNESFDEAIRDYALSYADQVEQDYEAFKQATRAGRFPIETLPSEKEQALR